MRIQTYYKRFKSNFSDPEFRIRALALVGGKLIGLTLVLSAMYAWIGSPLQAQAAPAGPTPEMNAINTAWTLIAAFLVFCMQVGFVMLEAGFGHRTIYEKFGAYVPAVEASPTFAMFALESGVMLGLWSRHTVEPAATASAGGGEIAFTVADIDAVNAVHGEDTLYTSGERCNCSTRSVPTVRAC